jgi:phage shock protein PspC (stress-responsive transcriptional regulator)
MTEQQLPPHAAQPPYQPYAPTKRLVRSQDDRWLSGVCGGVAQYLGIDANLVRLIVVLGTIFGLGSLFVAYIVAWIQMPEA